MALWIVYNEPTLHLDELVELDKSATIHKKTWMYWLKCLKQPEEKIQASWTQFSLRKEWITNWEHQTFLTSLKSQAQNMASMPLGCVPVKFGIKFPNSVKRALRQNNSKLKCSKAFKLLNAHAVRGWYRNLIWVSVLTWASLYIKISDCCHSAHKLG